MNQSTFAVGLLALLIVPSAKLQLDPALLPRAAFCLVKVAERLKTEQRDWDLSDGRIEKAAGNRLMTQSKEMRATLKWNTFQHVAVNFTYLGPSRELSRLGSGEIRHQFGVKLRAQDICNLVYVMWYFDTQKIAVSVKTNAGQRTHEECLD